MYTKKQIQKYERARYTRELERYLNRIVRFVSTKEFNCGEFENYVDEIFKPFDSIKRVLLNGEYYKKLEEFVEFSANLSSQKLDSDEIRKTIQYKAHQLQKIKRVKSFSKSLKYKNKFYG